MTKDNASGAGMEACSQQCAKCETPVHCKSFAYANCAYRDGADATRLLAESQAHNAKLEAQVERMREALQVLCDEQDAREGYASIETYDKARTALADFPVPIYRSPDVELVAGVLRNAWKTQDLLGCKALADQVLNAQAAFERIAALKP